MTVAFTWKPEEAKVNVAASDLYISNRKTPDGIPFLTLAFGSPKAPSGGRTGGFVINIPQEVEQRVAGCLILIKATFRSTGESSRTGVALCYSTADTGNSGWNWFQVYATPTEIKMEYYVPPISKGGGDFLGILPSPQGEPGVELYGVSIHVDELSRTPRNWTPSFVVQERGEVSIIDLPSREEVHLSFASPAWVTGAISKEDSIFLLELLRLTRPRGIIEIGVASGYSTKVLSSKLQEIDSTGAIYSFDRLTHFYADDAYRLGALLYDENGKMPGNVHLFPGVPSHHISSLLRDKLRLHFAFIDGEHRHPQPLIDLIHVLPVLEPGSLVVLHDVNLPDLFEGRHLEHGSRALFRSWNGHKVLPRSLTPNIGAIRLHRTHEETIEALLPTMQLPWEVKISFEDLTEAINVVEEFGGSSAAYFQQALRRLYNAYCDRPLKRYHR